MIIHVTEADIAESRDDLENNPISRALRRATGQTFRVFPGGVVFQVQSPYRTLFLPLQTCRQWMEYQQHGTLQPLAFEIDIKVESATHSGNRMPDIAHLA